MPPHRRELHPAKPRHQHQQRAPSSAQPPLDPHQMQQTQQTRPPQPQLQQHNGRAAISPGTHSAAGPAPGGGFELVPTSAVGVYQNLFPYPSFNPVQSACFERTYKSDDSMLVSAPTGSGKTGIMEIAICRLVASAALTGDQLDSFSVIYFGASSRYSS